MISDSPQLRVFLFLGVLILMFLIETVWPARSWFVKRSKRIQFSVGLAIVNNLFIRLVVASPFMMLATWVNSKNYGLSNFLKLHGSLEIVITIILFDFFDALKHKWFHRIGFMWRFHRVHHTDKHLDILTALRYHPGELLISVLIKSAWILIWGPSAVAFLAFEIVLNLASQFHHTNIDLGTFDNKLNKILVTPRYHAIHHTINRDIGDQNFTTIFSIWDRLLGTYADPAKTDVNLERLGTLQDKDIDLLTILKSPFSKAVNQHVINSSSTVKEGTNEFLNKKYSNALDEINSQQAILLDVRQKNEIIFFGNIKTAQNKPFFDFLFNKSSYLQNIIKSSENKKIYVFCKSGNRAQHIVEALIKQNQKAENLGSYNDCKKFGF